MPSISAVFCAMLFIVNLLIKTDPTVTCVPCMPKHGCFLQTRINKNRVIKEFLGVITFLKQESRAIGQESAGNQGYTTEDSCKKDKKIKKYSEHPKKHPKNSKY